MRTVLPTASIAPFFFALAIWGQNAPARAAKPSLSHSQLIHRGLRPSGRPNGAPVGMSAAVQGISAKEPVKAWERRPRVLGKVRATLSPYTRLTPPAMWARARPSPARTSASEPSKAQVKSPRVQVEVLAKYFTITTRRSLPRIPLNRKIRGKPAMFQSLGGWFSPDPNPDPSLIPSFHRFVPRLLCTVPFRMSSLEWICRERYVRPILFETDPGINQSLKGDPKAIGADLEAMTKDGTLKLNEGKYILWKRIPPPLRSV